MGCGVRRVLAVFARRLVAVEREEAPAYFLKPLDAALLWRQVAKATKAVTSHRTQKPCSFVVEQFCINELS
jgi:hypothetical protein